MRHWARFREWNEAIFYQFVLRALGRAASEEPLLAEDGMATYLVNPPFGELSAWRRSPLQAERDLAAAWDRQLAALAALYAEAQEDIRLELDEKLTDQAIYERWLSGTVGGAYAVGTTMVRVIVEELGEPAALPIAADCRLLLETYNRAARKANARAETHFVFGAELARRVGRHAPAQHGETPGDH